LYDNIDVIKKTFVIDTFITCHTWACES